MSKKGKKARRKTRKQRHRRQPAPMLVTGGPEGLFVSMSPVSEGDISHLETYMEAHAFLPQDLDFGALPPRGQILAAVTDLDARQAAPRRRLEALVLLGHSPCPEAVEALGRYGRTRKPYAGVAPIAMAECLDLIARGNPSLAS